MSGTSASSTTIPPLLLFSFPISPSRPPLLLATPSPTITNSNNTIMGGIIR